MIRLILASSLLLTLGACKAAPPPHEHEAPAESLTLHGRRAELFAEYPPLVAGEPSRFAVHVTRRAGWAPLAAGQVTLRFTAESGTVQGFEADAPSRPGIFRPVATLPEPGAYRLAVLVDAPGLTERFDAGRVTVHSDAAAAAGPEEESPDPEAIAFLLEQQWRVPFMVEPVAEGQVAEGVSLAGTVQSAGGREVVVSAPAEGRLVPGSGRLPVLGTKVSRGQVLAVLTPDEGQGTDRAGLEASARETVVEEARAEREQARVQRLVAAQALPARRLEEANAALAVARAKRAAAHDHLEAKTSTLLGAAVETEESYRLSAPLAGTVVEASAVPGAHVEAGQTLYRIVDLSRVWIAARAPEADLNRLAGARSALVTVAGAPEFRVSTQVTVGAVLDPATRTAPVIYEAPNPKGLLRLGMTASVRAISGARRGPVLPAAAVVDDNGQPVAYVQVAGEAFERRALTLGPKEGGRVLVTAGLKAGERVVTEGGYSLRLATLTSTVPAHGHAH